MAGFYTAFFGTALAPLDHDLAAVEGFELGAMCDADYGRSGNFLTSISIILSWLLASSAQVTSSSNDDVGVIQAQPRQGEPLLLAAGQRFDPTARLPECHRAVERVARDRFN